MDTDEIRAAVRAERIALVNLLADLPPDRWDTPSLCGAWSVKEVLAHLTTTTRTPSTTLVWRILKAGGSFHRMSERAAQRIAKAHSPDQLRTQLRETADSARRMPGSAALDPLADVLVHAQDIARPLALPHQPDLVATAAALDHVAENRFYGNPARIEGFRLRATDTSWEIGTGAEVSGPAIDLLLVATGRPAGLVALHGDGIDALADRVG